MTTEDKQQQPTHSANAKSSDRPAEAKPAGDASDKHDPSATGVEAVPQQYKGIVAWDFDGTITNPNVAELKIIPRDVLFIQKNMRMGPDVISQPKQYLLTCLLLQEFDWKSVPTSQRIQSELAANESKDMYTCLDACFGKTREFLKQDDAVKIATLAKVALNAQGRQATETNISKNVFLDAIQNHFKVNRQNIVLVDDTIDYEQPARDAKYQFIHAPLASNLGNQQQKNKDGISLRNLDFLYEVIWTTILAEGSKNNLEQVLSSASDFSDERISADDKLCYSAGLILWGQLNGKTIPPEVSTDHQQTLSKNIRQKTRREIFNEMECYFNDRIDNRFTGGNSGNLELKEVATSENNDHDLLVKLYNKGKVSLKDFSQLLKCVINYKPLTWDGFHPRTNLAVVKAVADNAKWRGENWGSQIWQKLPNGLGEVRKSHSFNDIVELAIPKAESGFRASLIRAPCTQEFYEWILALHSSTESHRQLLIHAFCQKWGFTSPLKNIEAAKPTTMDAPACSS